METVDHFNTFGGRSDYSLVAVYVFFKTSECPTFVFTACILHYKAIEIWTKTKYIHFSAEAFSNWSTHIPLNTFTEKLWLVISHEKKRRETKSLQSVLSRSKRKSQKVCAHQHTAQTQGWHRRLRQQRKTRGNSKQLSWTWPESRCPPSFTPLPLLLTLSRRVCCIARQKVIILWEHRKRAG